MEDNKQAKWTPKSVILRAKNAKRGKNFVKICWIRTKKGMCGKAFDE